MKRTLTVVALLLAVATSGTALSDALPKFDASGKALAQHLGQEQWVVVKIWASDCTICNREAHQYVDFYEFNEDGDVTVLGISIDGDNETAARDFIDRHEVTYPNLITTLENGAQWYSKVTGRRWVGTPTFLIYDRSGRLRAQQVGAVPTELIEQFIAGAEPTE